MVWRALKPTKQTNTKKAIFGFDIETYDDNKKFYCASVYGLEKNGKPYKNTFFTKQDVIDEFKTGRYRNSFVVATNLQFDFFGVFNKHEEIQEFHTLFRGSDLLMAKTFIIDGKFNKKSYTGKKRGDGRKGHSLTFIDTSNYVHMRVKDMGELLGIEKLKIGELIGQKPKTIEEEERMIEYNIRDAQVSREFMVFLFDAFKDLGASPKTTIASTAMSLFKNKYLKQTYWRQDTEVLKDLFKGYYGGRTEVFKRGKIENMNYYDINSLYPSVMIRKFPDPNSGRTTYKDTLHYIEEYEGISDVDIIAPDLHYPYLPFRRPDKLVFATGTWRGSYTHFELKKAMFLGYKITKVHKTHYYKETCRPFKEYVEELYSKRKEYKAKGSNMQLVVKLLLNSLYGKFGQKFEERDNWIPAKNITMEEIKSYDKVERINDFMCVKETVEPAAFCIPIWSAYVTAYARDVLFNYFPEIPPLYCDTDSIVSPKETSTSSDLGDMKLEYQIKDGIIVKPKMYAFISSEGEEVIKLKGVGGNIDMEKFNNILDGEPVEYLKFTKFKESQRRNMIPNQLQWVDKNIGLIDNKRDWGAEFDRNVLQKSRPLFLINGLTKQEVNEQYSKAQEAWQDNIKSEMLELIDSDKFDKHSVGVDIDPEEFIENEIFFETL